MFTRELSGETLVEIAEKVSIDLRHHGVALSSITPHLLEDEPYLSLGGIDVPVAGKGGLDALVGFLDVPTKFFQRVELDLQQTLLSHRLTHMPDENVSVGFNRHGIIEVLKENQSRVDVAEIVQVAMDVIHPDARVVEWRSTPHEFYLDVIAPEDFDRGFGGDASVGDITVGGLRFGQDRKKNLAPWVQEFLFRLACTNGMEMVDMGLRVDARRAEESEIIGLLKQSAERAFSRVGDSIRHFYDTRQEVVPADRTGHFRRVVQDFDLPERTVGALEDHMASVIDEGEQATTFHLINLVTNAALNPALKNGARRRLEQIGGLMVNDHASRCGYCHRRLN